jgi:hypothetical protein
LVALAGGALGLAFAILAQLAQGYPLWGLPGEALGTLLVAAPLVAWALAVLAVWLTTARTARPVRWSVLGLLVIGMVAAAGTGALLGLTHLGQYEWLTGP